MWWKSVLAFYAILPAAATVYFVVFWRWFDYWRYHRPLALLVVGIAFSGLGVVELVGRRWTFARELHPGAVVQGCGWGLIAVSSVLGTVADRQIGFRVRSFTPFFDAHGHLELKTTGAYGVVRHPIYAAGSAFQLGAFLVTGYPSVAIAWAIFTVGALWFTRQEEHRLVALLDEPAEYERYRQRVGALLPKIARRRADQATSPS